MVKYDFFEARFKKLESIPIRTAKDNIDVLRLAFGWGIKTLSRRTGIERNILYRIQNGTYKEMSIDVKSKILIAFPFIPITWLK